MLFANALYKAFGRCTSQKRCPRYKRPSLAEVDCKRCNVGVTSWNRFVDLLVSSTRFKVGFSTIVSLPVSYS
jgi:hypothetical protein